MSDISSSASVGGRAASMARRQALSQGKTALPPAVERTAQGRRGPPPGAAPTSPVITPAAQPPAPRAEETLDCACEPCQGAARQRRAMLSRWGRGEAPPAPPSRPPRQGRLDYAPKVHISPTQGGQVVTGPRAVATAPVTGASRGLAQPISGTQYIAAGSGADGGAGWRAAGRKVGFAKTAAGMVVSGTLVRGQVAVTGDEARLASIITGEADPSSQDDITPRPSDAGAVPSQFRRQADPHGVSVFGSNLGRSAVAVGSRVRERTAALESSLSGLPITGSAVGRSVRVTGDEDGACLAVTGSQYLTPAQRQVLCGGPSPEGEAGRRDPVTGAKVRVSQTWNGRRVTGVDVEHDPRVTGEAPGTCQIVTGTPYQGVTSTALWCDPAVADEAAARLVSRPAQRPITGDAPIGAQAVTGNLRGADRAITGSSYHGATPAPAEAPGDAVQVLNASFSVVSPQRVAHLGADRSARGRITGAFALGGDKITGAAEFHFQPRQDAHGDGPAPRERITGEGRSSGPSVTGDAWARNGHVTGVEGAFAADRNPSLRAGKPGGFAGAAAFKADASHETPKQLVTGMVGFASKTAAKVTLSGGAQG